MLSRYPSKVDFDAEMEKSYEEEKILATDARLRFVYTITLFFIMLTGAGMDAKRPKRLRDLYYRRYFR